MKLKAQFSVRLATFQVLNSQTIAESTVIEHFHHFRKSVG